MKQEEEIFNSMASYCSQAERCVQDVRKKMKYTDLTEEEKQKIIERLKQENFINEKRFSRSFVADKFRLNQWGRIKICYELKQKNIAHEIYYEALELIDEKEYLSVLEKLLIGKKRSVKGSPNEMFQKIYRFASSRGFESNLIIDTLKKIIKDADDIEVIE
ncbi:MAG: RecX family transcriptional regulator [Tannerella sp.]|jgi:regulatory protein|nr:RecX family transcriptional regulator [Tannerella sp.]